ncbi:hypothetical protein CDAR_76891 [Caerostris darwini]|uniref:Uncharacterized protein n=1 Tax=Caerostris darwini TaxID=1538125 RepID=A0AAV4QAZ7_9ARAC|nr:hypothetical protein CDAR_76891 [Caerostris darwini]
MSLAAVEKAGVDAQISHPLNSLVTLQESCGEDRGKTSISEAEHEQLPLDTGAIASLLQSDSPEDWHASKDDSLRHFPFIHLAKKKKPEHVVSRYGKRRGWMRRYLIHLTLWLRRKVMRRGPCENWGHAREDWGHMPKGLNVVFCVISNTKKMCLFNDDHRCI